MSFLILAGDSWPHYGPFSVGIGRGCFFFWEGEMSIQPGIRCSILYDNNTLSMF